MASRKPTNKVAAEIKVAEVLGIAPESALLPNAVLPEGHVYDAAAGVATPEPVAPAAALPLAAPALPTLDDLIKVLPTPMTGHSAVKDLIASLYTVNAPLTTVSDSDLLAQMGITPQIATLMGEAPIKAALDAKRRELGLDKIAQWNDLRPVVETALAVNQIASQLRTFANSALKAQGFSAEIYWDNGFKVGTRPVSAAPAKVARQPRSTTPKASEGTTKPSVDTGDTTSGTRGLLNVWGICKASQDPDGMGYLYGYYEGQHFYARLDIGGLVIPCDLIDNADGSFNLVENDMFKDQVQGGIFRPAKSTNNGISTWNRACRVLVKGSDASFDSAVKAVQCWIVGEDGKGSWVKLNRAHDEGLLPIND
jgi:hypothetical protein